VWHGFTQMATFRDDYRSSSIVPKVAS